MLFHDYNNYKINDQYRFGENKRKRDECIKFDDDLSYCPNVLINNYKSHNHCHKKPQSNYYYGDYKDYKVYEESDYSTNDELEYNPIYRNKRKNISINQIQSLKQIQKPYCGGVDERINKKENKKEISSDVLKRNTISFLLKDDIKIYRKYMKDIEKFNSEAINNLFDGISTYNYGINEHYFFLLVAKFQNYSLFINEFYEEGQEELNFLKTLWLKNISFENLANNNSEDKWKDYLSKKGIDLDKWPENIKEKLFKNISSTNDTIYLTLRNFFTKTISEEFNHVMKLIKSLYIDLEKNGVKETAKTLLQYGGKMILKYLNLPTIKSGIEICGKLILENCSNIPIDEALRKIQNNWGKFKYLLKFIYEKTSTRVVGVIQNIIKIAFIYQRFVSINNIMKAEKAIEKEIERIEKDFNEHKDKLHNDLNSCKFSEYDETLKEGIKKIEKCLNELIIVKNEIARYIEEVEKEKKNNVVGIVSGGITLGLGVLGGVLTGGIGSALCFIESGISAISIIDGGIKINKLKELNEKLKQQEKKANELYNKIIKELEYLKKLLSEDKKTIPIDFN